MSHTTIASTPRITSADTAAIRFAAGSARGVTPSASSSSIASNTRRVNPGPARTSRYCRPLASRSRAAYSSLYSSAPPQPPPPTGATVPIPARHSVLDRVEYAARDSRPGAPLARLPPTGKPLARRVHQLVLIRPTATARSHRCHRLHRRPPLRRPGPGAQRVGQELELRTFKIQISHNIRTATKARRHEESLVESAGASCLRGFVAKAFTLPPAHRTPRQSSSPASSGRETCASAA